MIAVREGSIVDDALALTFRISRLHGNAPLGFVSSSVGTFVYTIRPLHYLSVVSVLLYHTITLYLAAPYIGHILDFDRVLMMNTFFLSFLCIILNITVAFKSISRMKLLLECVAFLKKINSNINSECLLDTNKYYTTVIIGIFTIGIWIKGMLNAWIRGRLLWFYFEAAYLFGALILTQIQFALVVQMINSAFQDINKQLKIISSQLSIKYNKQKTRSRIVSKMRGLLKCYISTCAVVRKLNKAENVFMMLHLVTSSFYIVTLLNSFFNAFKFTEKSRPEFITAIFVIIQFFYNFSKTLLLVEPCHRTHIEALQTKMMVNRIMCYVDSEADPLLGATNAFYEQMILNDVSFSVMGICTLRRSIMSTIIGLSTSIYLMVKEL